MTPWLGTCGVRERWVRRGREATGSGPRSSIRSLKSRDNFQSRHEWSPSRNVRALKIFLPVFLRQTDQSCVNFYDAGLMMIMIVCIMYAVAAIDGTCFRRKTSLPRIILHACIRFSFKSIDGGMDKWSQNHVNTTILTSITKNNPLLWSKIRSNRRGIASSSNGDNLWRMIESNLFHSKL